jgi:UDP-N-acetyl-D-glucosamine dehydrogenase
MSKAISIVGLGYIGLPLALAASNNEHDVIGIDTDKFKVDQINKGISPIEDVSDVQLNLALKNAKFMATNSFEFIQDSEITIICVPTPLDSNRKPDLSYVEKAIELISPYLVKGTLLVLESTVAPGTTRNLLPTLVEKYSKLPSSEFYYAYSSERVDPLNKNWNLKNTPKIVAGLDSESREMARVFYAGFVDQVIEAESLEGAELAKLLENSFRLINISFINEFAMYCQEKGINVNEVISLASSKPYGFMPFYPSIGVGGHCIPVDPLYLADSAREIGASTRFLDLADQINLAMPNYFINRAIAILESLKEKKILVIGLSYKPNVADVRESPVMALVAGLKQSGAVVSWHDNLVKEWNGEKSVALSDKYDLAILATPHDYLDLTKLGSVPILNTRGSI